MLQKKKGLARRGIKLGRLENKYLKTAVTQVKKSAREDNYFGTVRVNRKYSSFMQQETKILLSSER